MPHDEPNDPRPPREEPPSGWKITGVLLALLALTCLTCIVVSVGYGYFLEIKSLR